MADQESASKRAAAKKAPAKKSSAKSTTTSTAKSTTKSGAKKSTAKKSTAKSSSSQRSASMSSQAPSRQANKASRVVAEVSRQFTEMSSKQVEGVIGLQRTEDGWLVELDVLELRRVPATTDVLARYEVTADSSGDLEGYRRLQRYVRGQAEDRP